MSLFEPDITIPHSDFKLFKSCNNASRYWVHKQKFYEIKNEILEKYGTLAGYDKQVVEQSCYTCNGTGWYLPNNRCRSCCGDGVYQTRTYILKRYVLNGEIFHRPVDFCCVPIVSTIKGLIKHSEPEFNENFSYACILKKYKPDLLPDFLRYFRKSFTRSDKKKWGEIASQSQSIIDALGRWYEVSEDQDLPF